MERRVSRCHGGLGAVAVTLCTIQMPSLQLHGALKFTTTGRCPVLKRLRTLDLMLEQWEQTCLVTARAPRPVCCHCSMMTLAWLQGIPCLCNSPGPEGPVPGAPVAHGTSFILKLPHLNHAHQYEDGSHLLPSRASLLSSKGSFSDFETSGRTSPRRCCKACWQLHGN